MSPPIYTPENCSVAYQLNWSYALFWNEPPDSDQWLAELQRQCEPDGIRLLQHRFEPSNVSQFLVSTKPHVAPILIAQCVKGRLQHTLRRSLRNPFRRNYSLRSIGSTRRATLDEYLAGQLDHHPMADERVVSRLADFQIHNPSVDLSRPRHTSHALYWYNLHVVFELDGGCCDLREDWLREVQSVMGRIATAKRHLLSRGALMPNHDHLALGCNLDQSPQEVALSYMNGLAEIDGPTRAFRFSYYVGTFGEYDLGMIPRP